jgi:CheY-like chemotaxis protein
MMWRHASCRLHRRDRGTGDVGLPGMDGYAVARALRADDELHDTYIAAVTGYARPEDITHAEEAGFDQHVSKPLSGDKLERIFGSVGGVA